MGLEGRAFDSLPEPGMVAAPHRQFKGSKGLSGRQLDFLIAG